MQTLQCFCKHSTMQPVTFAIYAGLAPAALHCKMFLVLACTVIRQAGSCVSASVSCVHVP